MAGGIPAGHGPTRMARPRGSLERRGGKRETKDSRLAREFVVALPIELSLEQWQTLLTDFVQNQFVADGMCADLAIHDPDPPGHNPHAHILLTVRPLDESGNGNTKRRRNISAAVTVRNGALPLPSLRLHRLTDGRNSTSTR